jgi:hypothetical protein
MSYNPRRSKSVVACVEMMEPREFLSASVAPAVHKTPPPIPAIAGETFTGTATAAGSKFPLSIAFATETAKGALKASVLFEGKTLSSSGTVKSTRVVTLTGKDGKIHFVLRGTLDSTLDTLTGKYTDSDAKGHISGPLSLTKTV